MKHKFLSPEMLAKIKPLLERQAEQEELARRREQWRKLLTAPPAGNA